MLILSFVQRDKKERKKKDKKRKPQKEKNTNELTFQVGLRRWDANEEEPRRSTPGLGMIYFNKTYNTLYNIDITPTPRLGIIWYNTNITSTRRLGIDNKCVNSAYTTKNNWQHEKGMIWIRINQNLSRPMLSPSNSHKEISADGFQNRFLLILPNFSPKILTSRRFKIGFREKDFKIWQKYFF